MSNVDLKGLSVVPTYLVVRDHRHVDEIKTDADEGSLEASGGQAQAEKQ
jgi:hypothetical protein